MSRLKKKTSKSNIWSLGPNIYYAYVDEKWRSTIRVSNFVHKFVAEFTYIHTTNIENDHQKLSLIGCIVLRIT